MKSFLKKHFLLLILLFITVFTRFYHLNWDSGFNLHPDERNLAYAVTKIDFPDQLNPQFFAYGSLPIYLYRLFTPLSAPATLTGVIHTGRFISATLSVLTVLFFIKILKRFKLPLIFSLFLIFNPGLIQAAHFATVETMLTFFLITSFYFLLSNKLLISVFFFALGVSTKISFLAFLPIYLPLLLKKPKKIFATLFLILGIFIVTNPYVLLDFSSFKHSINVESQIASGAIPVFYTRQFLNSLPFIFHQQKVFPFIFGSIFTWTIPFLILSPIFINKLRNRSTLLIIIAIIPTLFLNYFLATKWIRYSIPLVPLILLLFIKLLASIKQAKFRVILSLIILFPILHTTYQILHTFSQPHTTIQAADWINQNLPHSTIAGRILTEPYDLGLLPLSQLTAQQYTIHNFYDSPGFINLPSRQYFISLSQRVHHQPPANYRLLKVISAGPQLDYEETYRVFTNPTLKIYEKVI
jgi:hypothetical protein